MDTPEKQNKGFRLMSPERVKEIASQGGRTAHEMGAAHRWTSEESKNAIATRVEKYTRERDRLIASIPQEAGLSEKFIKRAPNGFLRKVIEIYENADRRP